MAVLNILLFFLRDSERATVLCNGFTTMCPFFFFLLSITSVCFFYRKSRVPSLECSDAFASVLDLVGANTWEKRTNIVHGNSVVIRFLCFSYDRVENNRSGRKCSPDINVCPFWRRRRFFKTNRRSSKSYSGGIWNCQCFFRTSYVWFMWTRLFWPNGNARKFDKSFIVNRI